MINTNNYDDIEGDAAAADGDKCSNNSYIWWIFVQPIINAQDKSVRIMT